MVCFAVPKELNMMKPTVEKVLKDVQLLSKRMRTREAFADELLNSVGTLQTNLESMRAFQEESLEFDDIVKRAEKHPRRQLITCLAAENKQLEQLKMQNKALETSLEEHELTLEMIMSKYREQISNLMGATETEKRVIERNGGLSNQIRTSEGKKGIDKVDCSSANDERLAVMAAIAKEVAEQSEAYSTELETELHRLNAENQALRELLAIQNNTTFSSTSASGNAPTSISSTATNIGPKASNGNNSPKSGTAEPGEWSAVPTAFK
ncbi:unnamed protein product [Rodentolepis nana]|uniref:FGFR1 oncogene partner 2 homolog n=1 Tax=Rodentolepis nana TaxID=102285 RepID=A0A0R3TWT2_RODNA|nr:unnamed protein product [Rodentolepis nana]